MSRIERRGQWPFDVRRLHPRFGAELLGIDLEGAPMPAAMAALREAFVEFQMILVRGQQVSVAAQAALARHFGEVLVEANDPHRDPNHPEVSLLSNLDAAGNPTGRHPDKGTLEWHTDRSWDKRPAQATIVYAEQVTRDGGETWYCDMYGAYDALDEALRVRLAPLRAVHSRDFSRSRKHVESPMTAAEKRAVSPVEHPIVRTHPESGRRCLFLGDHAEYVRDMDYADGRALIEEVNALSTRPELILKHRLRPRDLIAWDNRCLLHRVTPYDAGRERRLVRRSTVIGEAPA